MQKTSPIINSKSIILNLASDDFLKIAEASTLMVHMTDADHNIIYTNPTWKNFFNQDPHNTASLKWVDCLHPEDALVFKNQLAAKIQTRESFKTDYRTTPINDTIHWIFSNITLRFSETGKYLGFIASNIDISRYKQAELTIEENQQRYQEVLENIYDGIWTWDIESGEVFWNDRLYEMHGLDKEAYTPTYESFQKLIHPDDLDAVLQALKDHLEKNIPYDLVIRQKHLSGDYGWFFARGTAIRDENGKPVRMAGATIDITDRKKAEQALAESETRYSRIIEASRDGFWDWDVLTDAVYWSDSMYALCGLSPETFEITSERFYERVHPDDLPALIQKLETHFEHPATPFNFEYRLLHADGRYRYIHARGNAARDENGKPVQMSGIITDITERKQVEAALKESEERFRSMADLAPVMIIMLDPARNLIYQNRAWQEFTGICPIEPTVELNWQQILHPDDVIRVDEIFSRALQKQDAFLAEFRLQQANGEYRWINATFSPRMVGGEFMGFTGTLHDISTLKLAKEAAERSEEEIQELYQWERKAGEVIKKFQHCLDKQECYNAAVQAVGSELKVDRCFILEVSKNEALPVEFLFESPNVKSFTGVTPSLDTCPCLISSTQRNTAFVENLQTHRELPDPFHAFLKEYDIQGAAALPIHYNDELLCVLVLHTRTPKSWSEHEQQFLKTIAERFCISVYQHKVKERLEKVSQMKTQFISNLSHELRTPLNAVLGYAEMLEKGLAGQLDERQLKYTRNVVASGRHLLDMVNEILDLAKIESGKTVLYPEWLNLDKLMRDKYATFEALARKKNVRLSHQIAAPLEQIYVDRRRIKQVLLNLISNAIKFNRNNGEIKVRWHLSEDNQWAICEIEDTGIGIPHDRISELFTDFYQVDNSFSREHEGTGLGLSVTKRLIELHGGSISLKSQVGEGTTFTFQIPNRV